MKCPNCGAEISGNSKVCEFCGSSISTQMRLEQERLNKSECPKCGSTNISFGREKQGEIKGKRGTTIVRSTVGVCKDCGYTWQTDNGGTTVNKRKTWLWVLGWIFIFPLPLTILLLRKKEMNPIIKYGIIALAWLILIVIGVSGNSNESDDGSSPVKTESNSFCITEGESGEYGFKLTLNKDTEFEEAKYYYHIPAGEYTITNVGDSRAQVSVLSDEVVKNDAGWEEFAEAYDCVAFDANEQGIIHVGDNQCIEITEGDVIRFELN